MKITRTIINILLAGIVFSILAIAINAGPMSVSTLLNTAAAAAEPNAIQVEAGRGNASAIIDHFFPQTMDIKVGQSITWYNPTQVAEPHTVTFALENNTMTRPFAPFSIKPSSTQFTPIPSDSNNEPVKVPGKDIVVALNARSFIPTLIDSRGNVKHSAPNAAYTMDGTEKYVNSGFLLPKGDEKEFPGSGNTFTVKFQKTGTFKYACILHPWMQGTVIVR